jgi:hypothetical protein
MEPNRIRHLVLLILLASTASSAQVNESREVNAQPTPELKKLFSSLAGDWDTQEKREKTQFFPNGGKRKGQTQIRLAAGGAMLVMEGHSDGSAGPLSYLIVIWWDTQAKLYRYFTCFKDAGSGCQVRGTAHWESNAFVNDYEQELDGRKLKFRDTFQDITPNSYTLLFAWMKDDGSQTPVIVTKAVRRGSTATLPSD